MNETSDTDGEAQLLIEYNLRQFQQNPVVYQGCLFQGSISSYVRTYVSTAGM